MSTSWSQLMGGVLQSQAYKQAVYVAAGSYCEIVSVQEFNHIDALNTDPGSTVSSEGPSPSHKYLVAAALVGNLKKKVFMQSTFIVPSESPEVSLQDYRTVWDSTFGSFYVSRQSTGSGKSVPMAPLVLIEGSLLSKPQPYTAEELRSLLRPTPFNWADDVEDENEPISVQPTRSCMRPSCLTISTSLETPSASEPNEPILVQPTRSYMRPSCLTISTSLETPSASEPNSKSSTPITPFTPGPSPELPSFEVDKSHTSPLILSLDLAITNKKTDESDDYQKFDWLNLIRHDRQCALFQGRAETLTTEQIWEAYKRHFSVSTTLLHWSDLIVALDLAVPKEPECSDKSQDADQGPTMVVSEYLDVHQHVFDYAVHIAKISAEGAQSAPKAEVVEVELNADVEDNTVAERDLQGEDKTEECLASVAFEHIDLDAVFGGPADDLYEDYEERNRAARASINTASRYQDSHTCDYERPLSNKHTDVVKAAASIGGHRKPGWLSPQTWKYIPEDDNYAIMKYMEDLSELSDTKKRFKLASEMFNWHHMYLATEVCKDRGWYKHEPLRAADRFRDWFWEPTNGDNRRPYDPRILADTAALSAPSALRVTAAPKPHHLNFFQAPVYHKNDTAPEVSLWLVHSGHSKDYEAISYKGVLAAQAGKLIDPFVYNGPQKLLRLKGTKLRDAVTGYVDKVYHAEGSWMDDDYGMDEVQPKVIQSDNFTDKCSNAGRPQPPHVITRGDSKLNVPNVNDDGRLHWGYPIRGKKRTPSKLCTSEFARYEDVNDNGEKSETHSSQLQDPAVHDITNESGSETNPPGPSSPVDLEFNHESEAQLISAQSHHPIAAGANDISTVEQSHEDIGIVPQQSEDEVAADNHEFYSGTAAPQHNLEEGETVPALESDGSDAQEALLVQINKEFCNRPEYLATLRLVAAISEGRPREEIAAIQAENNEIYASLSRNTYVYEYDEDEDREDHTNSWTRQAEPSAENAEYLAQWSEKSRRVTAVQAPQENAEGDDRDHGDCHSSTTDVRKCLSTSSNEIEDSAHSEDAEHEEFEDESKGVIAAMRERGELPPRSPDHWDGGDGNLGIHPISTGEASHKEDIGCEEIRGITKACDDMEANSPTNPLQITNSPRLSVSLESRPSANLCERPGRDESLFTAAALNSAYNDQLIAHIEAEYSDNEEPGEANVQGLASLFQEDAAREISLRRYAKNEPLLTLEEEEALMDDAYVAGALLQEQADAQAEVLLSAYLGHLKRYHSMPWPTVSNKISSLEAVSTEAQSLSEQQDLGVGKSTLVSLPPSLPDSPPAVALAPDCGTMLRISYQYGLSILPSILEGEGEDSEEASDAASDLDCSSSGQLASEKRQNRQEVDLAYLEEASEDFEDGLVWDEDSQVMLEQEGENIETEHQSNDPQEHEKDVLSVSSEDIIDMDTENLDSLLSDVSGLLATFSGSDNAVHDSSTVLTTVPGVPEKQEEELDQDTLDHQHLAEEMGQLAAEARKLAAREKEVADRLEKLAGQKKLLIERRAQLAPDKELAVQKAEDEKAAEEVVDHAFDTISCPSAIPLAKATFNEHYFGSFAIAVGGKASKLAMGLSSALRSSAKVLHKG